MAICLTFNPLSFASGVVEYHILIDNQQQGPISMKQLQQMKNSGTITKDTMVWKNGMAGWAKAIEQQDLQSLFDGVPPPPPVADAVPPPPPVAGAVPPQSGSSQVALTPIKQNGINQEAITETQENIVFQNSTKLTKDGMTAYVKKYNEKKLSKYGETGYGIDFTEENKRGQRFYKAIKMVKVGETNSQWPKWRVVAYKDAFRQIQQDFLEAEYGKIAGDTLNDYFSDDSDNKLDFPEAGDRQANTKLAEIWDKVVALTGAKLDKALEELGVDPAEFKAKPLEQRKQLFKDNFVESSVKKAAGQLNGLITTQTFEGVDSKGNHSVGVIAMYYGKLKQLADDIVKKRNPMLTNKNGKPVSSYIPTQGKKLAETFGPRIVFNENGEPAIIAYGQWSYSYKGQSERKRARGYDHALKKAKTESQKQIAKFLHSAASYKEMEETNAQDEEVAIMSGEGNLRKEDIIGIIDKIQSTMKVHFKADLRGMKVAKEWSYQHPSGHEIIGVVTVWSQKNANSTDKVRNWKSNHKNPNENIPLKSKPETHKSGVNVGVDTDLDF